MEKTNSVILTEKNHILHICSLKKIEWFYLYDMDGHLIKESNSKDIDLKNVKADRYVVVLTFYDHSYFSRIVIIE